MKKPMEEKLMLIKPNKVIEMLEFEPGDNNLDFFYKHIGCDLIDIVPMYALREEVDKCEGLILIVDDEGAIKDKPQLNLFASLAYGHMIYGNVLLAKEQARDDGIYTVGLNEDDVKEFNEAMLFLIDNLDWIKQRQ